MLDTVKLAYKNVRCNLEKPQNFRFRLVQKLETRFEL